MNATSLGRRAGALGLAVVLATVGATAQANVRASVDRSQIAPGETLQLNIEHDGQTGSNPDLSPLRRDFEVLATSRSSQIQIVNGSASSSTDLTLTLSPKRSGRLTIPSLSWDGEHSSPIVVMVSASAAGGRRGSGHATGPTVFFRTTITPHRPYVQAAVHLTVRVYASRRLYRPDLQLPVSGNLLVRRLGPDRRSSAVLNGHAYQVLTRRYLLFPQHSGSLQLKGPLLDAQIAVKARSPLGIGSGIDPFASVFGTNSPFFGVTSTEPIRLHGKPIDLQVRPRPAAALASDWLPAEQVTLTEKWQPAQLQVTAGNPATVQLQLQAHGLTAAQLPTLSALWALPSSLKAYPDQAQLNDHTAGNDVVGTQDQTIALIADRPGHFTIPPLTLHWWDTATDRARTITIPGRRLVVLPAVSAAPRPSLARIAPPLSKDVAPASSAPRSTPAAHRSGPTRAALPVAGPAAIPWRWISAGLALLWAMTLLGWRASRIRTTRRRSSQRSAAPPAASRVHDDVTEQSTASAGVPGAARLSATQALASLREACRRDDARAARRQLLVWARATWPQAPPAGLNALGRLLGDAQLDALLRELDRACYAGESWDGHRLEQALSTLNAGHAARSRPAQPELAPLYR